MTHKRSLKARLTPYLEALKSRELTNREAATYLGVNEQYLSRILADMGFQKEPPIDRSVARATSQAKKDRLRQLANDPNLTPEEAAAKAGVSPRTIYRYRAQ